MNLMSYRQTVKLQTNLYATISKCPVHETVYCRGKPNSIRWQEQQLKTTEENTLSAQLFWEIL